MELTQKQEKFCTEYVRTGNVKESYRSAYDCQNMSERAIEVESSRMLDHPEISLRIQELRQPAVEAARITLTDHLNDLKRLRDLAEANGKYGPAVQAEVSRGKASGLYVEKSEITGALTLRATASELSDDELAAIAALSKSE